ncbi:MAG: hypothetical protein GY857_13440, partial [Desulfobacula sp.]|nr:hypothetical protein [Desulfobacula sp.]
ASTGELNSLKAAYEIISWDNAEIEIVDNIKKAKEFDRSLMNILMEGLRLKDERTIENEEDDSPEEQELSLDSDEDSEELELLLDESEDSEEPELSLDDFDLEAPSSEPDSIPEDNNAKGGAEVEISSLTTPDNKKSPVPDGIIEKKIAEFQKTIAMSCPICNKGKIHAFTTDNGKIYHACSNILCEFICWSKPYSFKCPLCSSPFLMEYSVNNDGKLGLKCPRKTCSFYQDSLVPPPPRSQKAPDESGQPKKRRKTVRIIRKKK